MHLDGLKNCTWMASKISILAGEGLFLRFLMIRTLNQRANMGEGRSDMLSASSPSEPSIVYFLAVSLLHEGQSPQFYPEVG